MRPLKLVPDATNIPFIRYRNWAMGFSLLLIAASLALVVLKGFNFGVDFAGGQMIRVSFTQSVPVEDLRARVDALGLGDSTIQQLGSDREVAIRLPVPEGGEENANLAASRVRQAVAAAYPGAAFEAVETVSPQVSNELYRTSAWALGLAAIAISTFIWIRFEWQFGVGALFALFHDVALTLGFFALTRLEFNLNVVAAILTIIGYSLNDTIVVYDRIRENLRKYRKMDIAALIDLSVNETLSRTVVTSLSLIIVLTILLLVGPDVIYGFTAAMLLGIGIGTFSSVYVSAAILLWLKVGPDSFIPKSGGPEGAERTSRNEEGII